MGINIENAKLEADILELARIKGLDPAEAIQNAISEELSRSRRLSDAEIERRLEEIKAIQERVRLLRGDDRRTGTELLDELYDERGLPV